ncbi:hypothetical protein FACS1894187_10560 [Synergistales bacterium]|nr:hypothetical protein FACS1894187_10560 [Synergistales bacterium]
MNPVICPICGGEMLEGSACVGTHPDDNITRGIGHYCKKCGVFVFEKKEVSR